MIAEVLDCVSFKTKSECLLKTDPYHPHIIIYGVILGISSLGIINNLVCVYIFSTCQSMNNFFFKYMNVKALVIINSFVSLAFLIFNNDPLFVDVLCQQPTRESKRLHCDLVVLLQESKARCHRRHGLVF